MKLEKLFNKLWNNYEASFPEDSSKYSSIQLRYIGESGFPEPDYSTIYA